MDEETLKYYESLIDMCMTQGWKNLMEEYSALALSKNSVEDTRDEKDLYYRKGQIDIIARLLNTESTIEKMMQEEGSNEGL